MTDVYYDAHNHLHDDWLAPHRATVLRDLRDAGVEAVVVNGTCEADWPDVAALCAEATHRDQAPKLLPSFGLHPWDVGNRSDGWDERLETLLRAHRGARVGEIGLDRWILDSARPDDPRLKGLRRAPLDEQLPIFCRQLELAADLGVPASIHCLDAFGPLLEALRRTRRPTVGFLLHAYSGSSEMAVEFAKLGAFFSFNGAFLDPRKDRHRRVFAELPLDRLLVETDAPAMSLPASARRFTLPPSAGGATVNHPANVVATYAGLAEFRGLEVGELATHVARNFNRLFTP